MGTPPADPNRSLGRGATGPGAFFRTVGSVLATQLVAMPIELATSVVLARALSVEDRGFYAVATEFAALVASLAELGLASAAIYRLRSAESPPARVCASMALVCGAVSLIAVTACWGLEGWIRGSLLSGAPRVLFAIAIFAIPFQLSGLIFSGVARGLDRFDLHNRYRLIGSVGALLAVGGAVALLGRSATSALGAWLAVQAIAGLWMVGGTLRLAGHESTAVGSEIAASLAFGLKTMAQSVLMMLHQRLDLFLIAGLLADSAELGVYAVAVGVLNRVRVIPLSIATTMFPTVAGLSGPEASRYVARMCRHSVLWIAISVVGLAALAPTLVPALFGADYARSVLPLLLLLPGVGFLTLYMVLARYFTALHRQQVNIVVQAAALSVNVGLNLSWIGSLGIVGAAAASLVSYSLLGSLLLAVFLRTTGERLRDVTVVRLSDIEPYRRRLGSLVRSVRFRR